MTAASLLTELRASGVLLRAVGSELRFYPSDLDATALESMRRHKEGLLAILRVEQATSAPDIGACASPEGSDAPGGAPVPEFGALPSEIQLRSLRVSDAALGAMLVRRDAVERHMTTVARRGCNACGREDWYENSHPSHRMCRHCHPPYGSPRPMPAPTDQAPPLVMPEAVPGAWACPRGHGSDPTHWRRWGCGACRLQAEVVS